MSESKMGRATMIKQVVAELVAEILVVFVKTFGTAIIAYSFGGLWASAFLGLFTYVTASVFTLQVNTMTDPIVNLMLLIMKAIDNRDERKKMKWRTVAIIVAKILIDVGVACLAGLAIEWIVGAQISGAVFGVQNMFAGNGDWATLVLTGIVIIVGYHVVAFILNYSADGMAACLALGVTYAVISVVTFVTMNGYFDYTVDIAIAIARTGAPDGINGWFWYLGILLVIGAAVTVLLYYLLWDMYFNADVMRTKRNEGTVNELTGVADEEHQKLEEGTTGSTSVPLAAAPHYARSQKAISALGKVE
jgi:hypothetical protein